MDADQQHKQQHTVFGMGPEFTTLAGVEFFATPYMPNVLYYYMRRILEGNVTESSSTLILEFSSDYIQALQDNIETPYAWIARVAESMTNGLRMTGPETNDPRPAPQYTGVA